MALSDKAAAIKAVVAYVDKLMAEDKKSTGLKALQVCILRQQAQSGSSDADTLAKQNNFCGTGLTCFAFAMHTALEGLRS